MKQWIIPAGVGGGPDGLRLVDVAAPKPGPGAVKIAMRAWSTNYRDKMVAAGLYTGGAAKVDTVPLSDGAGEIIELGPDVSGWKVGDRVAGTFFQNWPSGPFVPSILGSDLGGGIQGVLAEEVVLSQGGIARIPEHLSFEEAATLPCAALTAWNAMFEASSLKPGSSILTLGTGGVSIFAVQFALAAGIRVIGTSSSDDKLERLKSMGVTDLINYRATPEWHVAVGACANGVGVDAVIEVGGPGTLTRSLKSVRPGGTVALIGVLDAPGAEISPAPLIRRSIRLQGVYVGSRSMFEDMNNFIAATGLRPVIDRVFSFGDAPEAYRHQASGAHFGKVVISLG